MSKCTRAGLNSALFVANRPQKSSRQRHRSRLGITRREGVRVNYQQPPTRETKHTARVMRGLTIWTTTPNPQQHPLSLAGPATQQPCSPKCLASAHRHTPSLSDAPTPSHRSQTVRPDAKLRLPLPYSQPGSPRGQLPGIYLHKQTLSPTTSHSRSDASQHHRRRYQQHYRRNLPLPSAEGYAVWLFRGQSNCHVIKNPPCAAVDRRPPPFRTCRMPGSRPCLACQICTQQVGRDAHLNPRHRPCLTRR